MNNFKLESSEKYRKVGGWLYLLCFALIIGSPARTIYNFVTTYNETSFAFDLIPALAVLFYVDLILSTVLMVLSVRAGIVLWFIRPNALRIAKNYFLYFLGYSVIAVFLPFTLGFSAEENRAMIPEAVKSSIQAFVFFGIWFTYLNVSERVKDTYQPVAIPDNPELKHSDSENESS